MLDIRHVKFENCKFGGVYKRLPRHYNEYLIQIRVKQKDSIFSDTHEIYIDSSNIYDKFIDIKIGRKERSYFAHGMTDIDVYKQGGKYIINYSPTDSMHAYYILNQKNFDELIGALEDTVAKEE
jgi:hypothetical protein